MATRPPPHQLQVHPQYHHGFEAGVKAGHYNPPPHHAGPSATQILAIITLLPVCGTLLGLAGITLAGTLIGLMVAIPLFLLFSPIIVPAVIAIGLAVTGFLTSGALGLSGLSSLSWLLDYLRQGRSVPEQMAGAKRRMQDAVVQLGQKTKDVGQTIQNTAQDTGKDQGTWTTA
ncbi:PREDICTED: oleosin 18.2 kDa-like [Ipomoea nil]|uniref:oleosin 18.2 kDa-like n=1 Tax=Ipomoea nil TaxID=35883 RepID=UPI000901A2DD|nr:PREDICTED: oleosin 18.2 kDa-like [Ipomoea nil]